MDDPKRKNVASTQYENTIQSHSLTPFANVQKKPMNHRQLSIQLRCTLCILFCLFSLSVSGSRAENHQSLHDVYLANSEHELHVFRIYGKKPGKTIMLIGGIQGDEPGGYLTADLYADINLLQGNLIVVPRANFYSILLNQRDGQTGDMNRKFAEKDDKAKNTEQEIVSILKKLIGEADCLLNLHEGSGFFSPDRISDIENPDRFGQSIIFDTQTYFDKNSQRTIDLEDLATRVINRVNPQIENKRYHFKLNNHKTTSNNTKHIEQRKSASYYALTQANIPAFGVETSKSIRSNSEKVSLQKLVINAFMEEFGIIPDTPGLHHEKTELAYVLIKVNGGLPYAVPNGSKIMVESGDEVIVTDIIANLDRGLAADFLDMGSYNDTKLPFRIAKPTKVLIRKDAETCGWVDITIKTDAPDMTNRPVVAVPLQPEHPNTRPEPSSSTNLKPPISLDQLHAEKLLLVVDGQLVFILEGEEIAVPKDKAIILKGVQSNISRLDNQIFANLRGFAPPKSTNNGNDINYSVYPEQNLWVRYSENKAGVRYPIDTTYKDKQIGRFWIRLE
jgi:hypothetical protein